MSNLRVLALEPWLGGSHERFLSRWQERSSHAVDIVGLPARHWRWRMGAGAWGLAEALRVQERARPDVLFVSDYVDVPRLYGHLPTAWRDLPAVLYFHENQLTYPVAPTDEGTPATSFAEDITPGLTNLLSCLTASRVVFNSAFHRAELLEAGDTLLSRLPKPKPRAQVRAAIEGSDVIGPGIELDELPLGLGAPAGAPLRVGFPHRWEHDKDPATFLRCVRRAIQAGASIELVLLGERFERTPPAVGELLGQLGGHVQHSGYASDRAEYARLLGTCDVVVSTAQHEFYGLALLEGLATGALPLAPNRLSYPEVLPTELHAAALYASDDRLVGRLVELARLPDTLRDAALRSHHRAGATRHAAPETAAQLDRVCAEVAATATGA